MKATLSIAALAVGLFLAPWTGFAQECGDIDTNGQVNISDFLMIFDHTTSNDKLIPDTSLAEFDGKRGITIGDASALLRHLFESAPLSCGASMGYTLPLSEADTIFMPSVTADVPNPIPSGITRLDMSILFSFDTGTYAVYLPVVPDPDPDPPFLTDSTLPFSFDPSAANFYFLAGNPNNLPDTIVFEAYSWQHRAFTTDDTLITLHYQRVTNEDAFSVGPLSVDRSFPLEISVERHGELFRPVVVNYQVALPAESLLVSPNGLSFTGVAGKAIADTQTVEITSNYDSTQFSVTASAPWILLPNLPLIEPVTPFTLQVTVDAGQLSAGSHSGFLQLSALNPDAVVPLDSIPVQAELSPPMLFATGDVNCNGVVDIADLTMLIDHLFISLTPLPDCQ